MISVSQLKAAQPGLWTTAADDWNALLHLTRETADDIDGRGRGKVAENWTDAVGQKAAQKLAILVDQFNIASYTISSVTMILEGLATAVEIAQQTLNEALREASAAALDVADDGSVRVVESGLPGAAGDAQQPRIQAMVHEALTAATTADHDAATELRTLAAQVTTTDPSQVLDQVQADASQEELAMLGATIPSNATPDQVSAWWNSLTSQQQTELENALPTQLYGLAGIPQVVKDQLQGNGSVNKMTLVQFALDHWNDGGLDWPGEDNCTNFTSTALMNAGMTQSDEWHEGTFMGVWGWLDAETSSPSWGAAQNLHDLLTSHGGQVVPLSQAKPGDIIFWQYDGGDGNAAGHIHHTAIVTAVLPNGDIRYTQHSDSAVDSSLDGRSQQALDVGGAQHPVVVRLNPNGY